MNHRNPQRVADGGQPTDERPSRHDNEFTEYDWKHRPVAEAVVETVADWSGEDPTTLPPLQNFIECDQLNRLFAHRSKRDERRAEPTVSFEYADCVITVTGDGVKISAVA